MEKKIKIYPYSSFGNYTVTYKGDNCSNVVTKMVQLAGRYCEHYASDIYYDIATFVSAVEDKSDFDRYLLFRENGVTVFNGEQIECINETDYIQAWHLTYNAETEEQKFERVDIIIGRVW